jgi:hypothetical protein
VVDVVETEDSDTLVIFEGGSCLNATWAAGGSTLVYSDILTWPSDEMDEAARSVLGGGVRTFREWARGGRTRG